MSLLHPFSLHWFHPLHPLHDLESKSSPNPHLIYLNPLTHSPIHSLNPLIDCLVDIVESTDDRIV